MNLGLKKSKGNIVLQFDAFLLPYEFLSNVVPDKQKFSTFYRWGCWAFWDKQKATQTYIVLLVIMYVDRRIVFKYSSHNKWLEYIIKKAN